MKQSNDNVHSLNNAYVQKQKYHYQQEQRFDYVKKIHKRRLTIVGIVLLVILVFFGFQFIKIHHNIATSQTLIQQNQANLNKEKAKNESLNLEIKQLKDPLYVQKYIRSKYFYSKDNETIYNLPSNNASDVLNQQNKK